MVAWKEIGSSISGVIAFISCPCHLPITLPIMLSLTAGTGFGVWLASHQSFIAGATTVVFIFSLLVTFRWAMKPTQVCPVPEDTDLKHKNSKSVELLVLDSPFIDQSYESDMLLESRE
jgi:mercuric ion transport protein